MNKIKTSRLIDKIEIKRFRSFGNQAILAKELNIYSGKNNSGKSNILKALNLFFNNKSGYDSPYNHGDDYNKAFRGASTGGRTAIEITVHFLPLGNGALRHKFSIKKTFSADSDVPETTYYSENLKVQKEIDGKNGTVTRQFTRFLNKIEYIYIPAVRDRKFVKTLLLNFEVLIKSEASGKDFDEAIKDLSDILGDRSIGISREFEKYIHLPTKANLSSNTSDILGAVEINVNSGIQIRNKKTKRVGGGEIVNIPIKLFSSGDGILMSYLVYFLVYLTKKSKKQFIWGFEEPENSLEYSKVQDLAKEFIETFIKNAQIFITTHSPAFINLKENTDVVEFYRVYISPQSKEDKENHLPNKCISQVQKLDTIYKQLELFNNDSEMEEALNEELHLVEQAQEIQDAVTKVREEKNDLIKERDEVLNKNKLLLEAFPKKIFICEDESSVGLWTSLLLKVGLKDVKVMSSNGCHNDGLEIWIEKQTKFKNDYHPVVFREMDRDGYLENQLKIIQERQDKMPSGCGRYKYVHLPVNELENFALINEPLCTEEIWSTIKDELKDVFERVASDNINVYNKHFYGDCNDFPIGKSGNRMQKIQEMRREAEKDWVRLMPGKEISQRILNFKPVTKLKKSRFEDLPQELRDFLNEAYKFFEEGVK